MTASRHRAFVRQRMGVSYEAAWVRAGRRGARLKDMAKAASLSKFKGWLALRGDRDAIGSTGAK